MGAIFIRTLIIYLFVLVAIRLMGKREIGQLQPFELVVTIMIADLASVPMQDIGIPILHGIIPILALLVGQLIISYINIKNKTIRKFICGRPTILIQKGKIIRSKLLSQKYAIEGLMEQFRVSGYPDISAIEYAILETSGEISVIPKPEKMQVTLKDLNLPSTYKGYPRTLVIDGEYMEDNMRVMGYDKKWVDDVIKKNKSDLEHTFLLISDEGGQIFFQKKD